MAPGGQGALVDVCNSKAHPQCRVAQAGLRVPRGQAGAGEGSCTGQLDTGASKCRGWGGVGDHHIRRGDGPREGKELASATQQAHVGKEAGWGLSRGDRRGFRGTPGQEPALAGPGAQHDERADGDPPGTATSPTASKPSLGQAP